MKSSVLKLILLCSFSILSACNHSGGGSGGGVTPDPSPMAGARFAYVLNAGSDSVGIYSLAETPQLISTATTGGYPYSMTMTPDHKFLYTVNLNDSSISQFAISDTGTMTAIAAAVVLPMMPMSLTVSNDGKFLYIIDGSDQVTRFQIDSQGQLRSPTVVAQGLNPISMIFAPSGHYAYVLNYDATMSQFSVSDTDGSLTALAPASVASMTCPTGPMERKTTQDGHEVIYVLSCVMDQVEVLKVGGDGTLSSVQVVSTGPVPEGMTVAGSHLYTINSGDGTASIFDIGADGTLAMSSGVAVADLPETITVDAKGRAAFVLDFNVGEMVRFSVSEDGSLVKTSKVSTGDMPKKILLKP